ncbi:MAG: choice-of-anchor D domain-containing protein [Archangium sp.]|nr:choice-of-anchor D domain-containing protein [Archangium sp.]
MKLLPILVGLSGCLCLPPPPPMEDAGVDGGDEGTLEFTLEAFSAVLRGDSVLITGTFSNSRNAVAEVRSLAVSGASYSLVGPATLEVPAQGEATLQLKFAPESLGGLAGQLTFEATGRPYSVNLRGIGIGPALELTPDHLELGTIPLYDGAPATASAMLTLRNVGIDVMPSRPETALRAFFDVQSTSGGPPGELCAGDCTAAPLSVPVDALTVVPVTLTATTPGIKTWDLRLFSSDPTASMRTVPVTAEVVARPTCQFSVPPALSFGVLTAPEIRDLEVIFENVGTEACEVSRIDVGPELPAQTEPLFSVVNAPVGRQSVGPGEVLRVTVRAWPRAAPPRSVVSVTAELRLELNHPDGFARVPLDAQLELTCLSVTPSPVDFAMVQTGCRSADRTITVRNTCTRTLEVTSATLPGFSSFSLAAALPRTLPPDDSFTLTARYTPFAVGPSRGIIDVSWVDAMVTKHTIVPLLGEANATGLNTDLFPPRGNKLDVLLVIDDSCSMMEHAMRLGSQLPNLLGALQSRNIDFRLGVLTASYDDGALRRTPGGAKWLTPSTPDLATRFAELTAWTGRQMIMESCEVPVLAALTAPFVIDPAKNGGFLRPDAPLEVLCITDTNEGAYVINQILPVKPGGSLRWDVVGPAGPSAPGCNVNWFPNRVGHQTYTQATGGKILDVCATDWSPLLNEIAGQTTGPRSVFPLRATPDPLGSLPFTVAVAGQDVSATTDGGTSVWAWEPTPNAVRFTALYAPPATDPVEIRYPVSCAP